MPKKLCIQPGQQFGRWTTLRETEKIRGNCTWECACSCGTLRIIDSSSLVRGATRSCGCAPAEALGNFKRTHGLSRTSEYLIWRGILSRCTDADNPAFKHYGGRGITVCAEWMEFTTFLHDMGKRPSKAYSIERKNNDEGYSKANCVWATAHEQGRNKRTNHRLQYKGKSYVLVDLADLAGIEKSTFRGRLRAGWSVEQAVETPPEASTPKTYEWKGLARTALELSIEAGVTLHAMRSRLRKGTVEQAMSLPPKYDGPPRKVSHHKKGSKYWFPPVELKTP